MFYVLQYDNIYLYTSFLCNKKSTQFLAKCSWFNYFI
nr:MAG TPA: hypothetical protein [Caudoviricetes sp.]